MRIRGTRNAENRRDKRMTARPLTVEIDDVRYAVEGWSVGGFLVAGYRGDRVPGDNLEARVIFTDEPETIDRLVRIEIARVEQDAQSLAARFVDLDDDSYAMLEGWISGPLRRAMRAN